jgi:hypothetical protein
MRNDITKVPRPLAAVAPQPLKAGSGPNHAIVVKNGARSTFVTFNTDAPSVAETSSFGPANIVRLNDADGAFARGVPGFLGSLDEVFCWLRGLSAEMPLKFVGEGVGASVALLAGMLIPNATVLAVNPVLAAPGSHPFWGQVEALAATLPARQGVVTVLSCWEPISAGVLGHDKPLPPAFGAVVEMPCRGSGMAHLRRKGGLETLLDRGVDALRALVTNGVVSAPHAHGKPHQYRAFADAHLLSARGASGRKRAMTMVEDEADWSNPGWQHLRAQLLRREKMMAEALVATRAAANAAPDVQEFCVAYAKLVHEEHAGAEAAAAAALLEPFLRQKGISELRESLLATA